MLVFKKAHAGAFVPRDAMTTPRTEPRGRSPKFPPALTVLVVVAVLYFARDVLIPIALAVLLAFLLGPLVRRIERLRVPRVLAVCAVVGGTMLVVGAVGWVVQVRVLELATNLPVYKENIRTKLRALRPDGTVLDRAGDALKELEEEISKPTEDTEEALAPEDGPVDVRVVQGPSPPLSYARSLLGPVLSRLATAGIVLIFAVFILLKREDLRNRMLWLIGERSVTLATPALDDAAQRVSRYLLMQTVANGIAGLAGGMGLFLVGVPSAGLWGLLYAVFRYIPYVGGPLGAAMPLALSIAVSPGWGQPLMVVGVIAAVEIVVANVIEPLLYGSKTGLSPLAILVAAVFWAWLWGPVGLLLATPLTVCVAVIGRHVPDLAFLDVLLGDEPVLTPPVALYQRLIAGDQDEAGRLVDTFGRDTDMAGVYDDLLVPVMRLAEFDRQRGVLTPQVEHSVHEMVALLIEDQGAGLLRSPTTEARAMCVPARDRSDELAARMLAGLLGAAGVEASSISDDVLTGELLDRIAEEKPLVVCIAGVSPRGALAGRVLYKRIRARFPDLAVVLGVWGSGRDVEDVRRGLGASGMVYVEPSLRAASERVRSLAGTIEHGHGDVKAARAG